jgi:gas vesicle protein
MYISEVNMSKLLNYTKGFIAGGILGGAIALLTAPKKGSELRSDIKQKFGHSLKAASDISKKYVHQAKQFENDLVKKAENIYSLVKDYAEGKYNGNIEKFEDELKKLKKAFYAAADTYRHYGAQRPKTESIVEEIFSEYENEELPKTEGMHKRSEVKVK